MLQPAKKKSELFAVRSTQHRRPVELFLAIAAAAFLVHRIIFELQQQQLCMCA